jgi:hypothetical protein
MMTRHQGSFSIYILQDGGEGGGGGVGQVGSEGKWDKDEIFTEGNLNRVRLTSGSALGCSFSSPLLVKGTVVPESEISRLLVVTEIVTG